MLAANSPAHLMTRRCCLCITPHVLDYDTDNMSHQKQAFEPTVRLCQQVLGVVTQPVVSSSRS